MRPVRVKETECRRCHGGGWAARFDPRRRTIHLGTKHLSRRMKKALLGHEIGHAVADELICRRPTRFGKSKRGIPRRRCRYVGQHDPKMFFPVVERAQRILRVRPEDAHSLERQSGYTPPENFMRPRKRLARFLARRRR